ncbi:MAG: hypothetical protein R2713_11515 [Ilumatobacteraceae bacterium]
MGVEQPLDGRACRCHLRIVEVALGVPGCVAGREQQGVALAERDVEVVGEGEHQLRARPGTPGLDTTEVPCRHPDVEGEVELAAPAAGAPVAHQFADGPAPVPGRAAHVFGGCHPC